MIFSASRFRSISPLVARAILVLLAILIAYGLSINFVGVGDPGAKLPPGKGDVLLYKAIIARVRGGEPYYPVVGAELFAREYPLRPFLTWRLPTAAWLIAALPNDHMANWLLIGLGLAVGLLWMRRFGLLKASWPKTLAGTLLVLSGLIGCAAPDGIYFQEIWAMVLIAGALAVYDERTWGWSVILGTLAMLFRELALPFACAMLVVALIERRHAEVLAWTGSIAIFGLALGLHAALVNSIPVPAVVKQSEGWLAFGGWRFILAISQWNVVAAILPKMLVPVFVPLALLGLAAWNHRLGTRCILMVALYVGAFLVVGRANNDYWGFLFAPLLPLGLLFVPAALSDLWRAAVPWQSKTKSVSQQT